VGKPRFFFNIDVLGSCNLRCPSCPVGNSRDIKLPTGFMDPRLLAAIIAKAKAECAVVGVGLFNWTEPVLHPKLPELIRIVESNGIPCHLSSNLNQMRNIDAILAANPYSFRISASGFTQDVYGYTHRGGDIERVKQHMIELADAKRRLNATTLIHVLYHRYKHNLADERPMREFAHSLGIGFEGVWAFMMPLEKILAYVDDDPTEATLTDEDHQLIGNLALPLKEAIAAAEKHREAPCSLRDGQMTMDFEGNVQLCCSTYDTRRFTLGKYLASSFEELQAKKHAHDMCARCMHRGVHVYGTYGSPEFDNIAARTIGREGVRLIGLSAERRRERLRRGVEWLYRHTAASYLSPAQSARLGRAYARLERTARRVGTALFTR
jgi:MoaA/NifB/PqqE/SkfB family radical SAM enzyme